MRFAFLKPLLCGLAALMALTGCAKLTLAWTDLKPAGPVASPPVMAGIDDRNREAALQSWQARASAIRQALQQEIYGAMPDDYALSVNSYEVLDEAAFSGAGRLSEYTLQADVSFNGERATTNAFYMNVVTPRDAPNAPVILMQTFCPRWDTIPHASVQRPDQAEGCDGGGVLTGVMNYVFGRYIATPPIEEILARGYAIATIFPSEYVPDEREEGLSVLADLSAGLTPDRQRWGAIAAWAWGYSLMIDALEGRGGGSGGVYVVWGHSRYGKSALLAAAFDDRIDAVIAHQSGTGGASLNSRKKGESVKEITDSYPHWFAGRYAEFAGNQNAMSVDQHHLLALIAPRPMLLGNARRDVWSDPNGAFRAAMGADPVYELHGRRGLAQERLDHWTPSADIAFWIRPGTHGIVKEDWPAFLEFLDAHVKN
ncbi:alpha/beta hydrolase [Hyphococcus sp.]|uniref:glucuronyl esterase domain-containing protein n=1 Tax=Hyphococcus sp. TaxID=2038636 RepID=UPI003CCBB3F7